MSTMLSEHFSLEELTDTETGFDNTPDDKAEENLKLLCITLERIRTLLGKPITISSGYRSTRVNKAVKGALSSAHLDGRAADIKVKGMTPYEVCKAIQEAKIPVDQVIFENLGGNGGWTHIGIAKVGVEPRNQFLSIHPYTGYLQGIVENPNKTK